jgi:hypothetical protein
MGFSLSWAAVKGSTPAAVLEALALRGTGATEEIPESEITGAELPGGWYLIVSQRDCLDFINDKVLARLSSLGEVVTCFVEEHVMCSFAACWRGGQRVWSVYHDSGGRNGNSHLEIKGEPPPVFAGIRDKLTTQQEAAGGKKAGVDFIFDVPVEVARSVAGYRHDEDIPELSKLVFQVLARTQPHRKVPWFKKLFGA